MKGLFYSIILFGVGVGVVATLAIEFLIYITVLFIRWLKDRKE